MKKEKLFTCFDYEWKGNKKHTIAFFLTLLKYILAIACFISVPVGISLGDRATNPAVNNNPDFYYVPGDDTINPGNDTKTPGDDMNSGDNSTIIKMGLLLSSNGDGTYVLTGVEQSNITVVEIPSNVTKISHWAFEGCYDLEYVSIPSSVTRIEKNAFYQSSSFAIYYGGDATSWNNIQFGDRWLKDYHNLYLNNQPVLDEWIEEVPATCTDDGCVAHYACSNCGKFFDSERREITNYSIQKLGHSYDIVETAPTETEEGYTTYACSRCGDCYVDDYIFAIKATNLQYTLLNGTYAVSGYTGTPSEVVIPIKHLGVDVTSVGESAFYECTSLTSITIPDSVTSIGAGAFSGCSGLVSMTIPFVGAVAGKTSSDTYQYPFGYIFGTSFYIGGTATTQFYYESTTSYPTDTTYCIPSSLRSVTVTGGNILLGAFYNCSMLTSITIGNGVTSIEDYAFYYCTSLVSITIPGSVTSIGGSAFSGCTSLTSIAIGNGVTSIGGSAFYNCKSLTSIMIPDSVTSIDGSVFYECTSLTSITIGNGVTSIGNCAFYNCTSLTSITIPDSVTSIGEYAFSGCTATIAWGNDPTITTIGNYAFSDYKGTSITIPDSVTSIGDGAFRDCTSLASVHINDIASWCGIKFYGYYDSNPLYYAHNLYINNELVTDLVIPDGVTEIKDNAFRDATCLTSVTIPESLRIIGSGAFNYCIKLIEVRNLSYLNIEKGRSEYGSVGGYARNIYSEEEGSKLSTTEDGYILYTDGDVYLISYIGDEKDIMLPTGVTKIYNYAISRNSTIETVIIPDGINWINDYAFYNCTNLTTITIPDSLHSIGSYVFNGCNSLTTIEYQGTKEQWNAISKGSLWSGETTGTCTINCTDGFYYK